MAENIKELILQAAAEKMRVAGIRSVSIDDICRELGMSKKTFYVYFETKDQLIDALLRRREELMQEDLIKKTKGKTIVELVYGFITLIKNVKDVRQVPALVYDLQKYYPQQLQAHLERLKMVNRTLAAQYLRQGIEEGFFRKDLNIDATARVIAGLHQVMLDKMSHPKSGSSIIQDSKLAIDIFFRGIVSEQGKAEFIQRMKE